MARRSSVHRRMLEWIYLAGEAQKQAKSYKIVLKVIKIAAHTMDRVSQKLGAKASQGAEDEQTDLEQSHGEDELSVKDHSKDLDAKDESQPGAVRVGGGGGGGGGGVENTLAARRLKAKEDRNRSDTVSSNRSSANSFDRASRQTRESRKKQRSLNASQQTTPGVYFETDEGTSLVTPPSLTSEASAGSKNGRFSRERRKKAENQDQSSPIQKARGGALPVSGNVSDTNSGTSTTQEALELEATIVNEQDDIDRLRKLVEEEQREQQTQKDNIVVAESVDQKRWYTNPKSLLLLLVVAIGVAVGAYFGASSNTEDPSRDVPLGTTFPPTETPVYDPPTPEECIAIRNGEWEDQGSSILRIFHLSLDVTFAPKAVELNIPEVTPPQLQESIQGFIIPELTGCKAISTTSPGVRRRMTSATRQLEAEPFVVANGVVKVQLGESTKCLESTENLCLKFVSRIQLFLKGPERNVDMINTLATTFSVDDLVEELGLPTIHYHQINIVSVEAIEVTPAPSQMPSYHGTDEGRYDEVSDDDVQSWEPPIDAGCYYYSSERLGAAEIRSLADTTHCLGTSYFTYPGQPLTVEPCENIFDQLWGYDYATNTIQNVWSLQNTANSDGITCIGIDNGSAAIVNGAALEEWPCDSGNQLEWKIHDDFSGLESIAAPGKCMQLPAFNSTYPQIQDCDSQNLDQYLDIGFDKCILPVLDPSATPVPTPLSTEEASPVATIPSGYDNACFYSEDGLTFSEIRSTANPNYCLGTSIATLAGQDLTFELCQYVSDQYWALDPATDTIVNLWSRTNPDNTAGPMCIDLETGDGVNGEKLEDDRSEMKWQVNSTLPGLLQSMHAPGFCVQLNPDSYPQLQECNSDDVHQQLIIGFDLC
eukprot:scaffold609_cov130-Cylindrotheca_fusiformis.AAC.7